MARSNCFSRAVDGPPQQLGQLRQSELDSVKRIGDRFADDSVTWSAFARCESSGVIFAERSAPQTPHGYFPAGFRVYYHDLAPVDYFTDLARS